MPTQHIGTEYRWCLFPRDFSSIKYVLHYRAMMPQNKIQLEKNEKKTRPNYKHFSVSCKTNFFSEKTVVFQWDMLYISGNETLRRVVSNYHPLQEDYLCCG